MGKLRSGNEKIGYCRVGCGVGVEHPPAPRVKVNLGLKDRDLYLDFKYSFKLKDLCHRVGHEIPSFLGVGIGPHP